MLFLVVALRQLQQLVAQQLQEVRRRQEALVSFALADSGLERRHGHAGGSLAQRGGHRVAPGGYRRPGRRADRPRVGGGQPCRSRIRLVVLASSPPASFCALLKSSSQRVA